MKTRWSKAARSQALKWHETDLKTYNKIKALIEEIEKSPFQGMGKPEPLKYKFRGWWSRRITQEHRLVYRVSGANPQLLEIASCEGHYK